MNPDGEQVEMVRKRRFPIVGNGAGIWSLVHIHDAAAAAAAAVEEASPACTTWSTTSPRRCPSRCRSWHG